MDTGKAVVQCQKMGSHSPSPSLGGGKEPSTRAGYEATSGQHFDPSVREITDIPADYLNQSQARNFLFECLTVAWLAVILKYL